jgi:CheY-like chemotaxis protein
MNILVIDDYKPSRELLQTLLTAKNHQVEVAKDGLDAAPLVTATKFDLILLDLIIPQTDTLKLATQLRSQTSSIIAIMHTSGESPDLLAKFAAQGFSVHILKSTTNHTQLITDIENILPKPS